jgi:hypothetical protein
VTSVGLLESSFRSSLLLRKRVGGSAVRAGGPSGGGAPPLGRLCHPRGGRAVGGGAAGAGGTAILGGEPSVAAGQRCRPVLVQCSSRKAGE